MSPFKRTTVLVRQIVTSATPYLKQNFKQISAAFIVIASLIVTLAALQHSLKNSESADRIIEPSAATVSVNPAASHPGVNNEPFVNAKAEQNSEQVTVPQQNSNPSPATVLTENQIVSQTGVTNKKQINQPAKEIGHQAENDEKAVLGLVSLEENDRVKTTSDEMRKVGSAAQDGSQKQEGTILTPNKKPLNIRPKELRLNKARKSFDGDLRILPSVPPEEKPRPQRKEEFKVKPNPTTIQPQGDSAPNSDEAEQQSSIAPGPSAPAPAPITTFDGLGRTGGWGNGYPPDPSGDVGPNHYIQAINTALAIYDKNNGNLLAGPFSFDTLMSQGNFGNLCDNGNFGDPVVLYDTFEDRWIVTDFAFVLSGNNAIAPAFQCFAVSKTGDPVSGGWNFYSIMRTDGLNDYPKFGVWTDGIYMSANMFGFGANGPYQGSIAWAFNKAQMYAGAPSVQIVSFSIGAGDFTVIPSNARLQTGTPPPGSPNYFLSTWSFLNGLSVYKFSVNWNKVALSSFSGPNVPLAATSWPNASVANAPQSGTAQLLDTLNIRAMMQNSYSNIGGAESLWVPHTVRRVNTAGAAAPRWYQVNVTGGTVAANLPQATTWDPDGNNDTHRTLPSMAVDRAGNMAIGYTATGSNIFPSIRYAGRLATDPVNTFSQTEQTLFAGSGSQTNTTRWGDYSHMSLDPDGCTFWFTTQYYAASGSTYNTRIGSFKFNECTTIGNGALEGTVTSGGNPLGGVTVSLGNRTTTTDANGFYSFSNLPAGTYPSITASKGGYTSSTATTITVNEGATATRNFTLNTAATNDCPVDTLQNDFFNDVATDLDLATSPGNVMLAKPNVIDQQNTTLGTQGASFSSTTWLGQTFTPAITGQLTRVDINFFSLNCGAVTMPNVTVSIRNASADLPTGTDLATATISGFCNGGGGYFTANFATPVTVNAGTQYAIVWRAAGTVPAGTPAPGYFGTVSTGATGTIAQQNPYANGRRAGSTNSGSTWGGATGTANNDHGFRVYINSGYTPSGTLVSGLKDANPGVLATPTWGTISWTATTPAGTDVKFQAASSNNAAGVFNFVGPDGTANSYFTNGGSLAQFNGSRYLRYKAVLTGTSTATPTLSDVSICFANNLPLYGISGKITYGNSNTPLIIKPVPGVQLSSGASNPTAATNLSGIYALENFTSGGTYVVTPSKSGDVNDISPFDATMILRHIAANGQGPNALNTNQRIAADTSGDGNITPFDATLILRYVAAGAPNANTGKVSNWKFDPVSTQYTALNGNVSNADYSAILIGEVSGGWVPPTTLPNAAELEQNLAETAIPHTQDLSVIIATPEAATDQQQSEFNSEVETVEVPSIAVRPAVKTAELQLQLPENAQAVAGSIITVPLYLTNASNKEISSYSFAVRFDPKMLQPIASGVESAESLSSHGFTIVSNTNTPGRIGIAASSLNGSVKDSGTLLFLRFQVADTRDLLIQNAISALRFEATKKTSGSFFESNLGEKISSFETNGSFRITAAHK